MAKNYMEEVAQLLGVELEEEFKIKGLESCIYKFTSQYLTADCGDGWDVSSFMYKLFNGEWEIEKSILTDKEKEYLNAVIKPFRNKTICIFKEKGFFTITKKEFEQITIHIKEEEIDDWTQLCFPSFKPNTMYKNLELNKEYTLEELGL